MRETLNQQIREAIGAEAHALLLRTLGGRQLFIPKKVGANHPLSLAIGPALAQTVCDEFSGLTLDIPLSQHRRALIEQDLRNGLNPAVIARRYWCTRRTVFYVQAAMKSAPKLAAQGSLF